MRISDWSSDVCSSDLSPRQKWRFYTPRQGVSRFAAISRRKPRPITASSRGSPASLAAIPKKRCADKDIRVTCGIARHYFYLAVVPSDPPPLPSDPSRSPIGRPVRSEEHTSELLSLMRISYAVFCLKHKHIQTDETTHAK